MTPFDSYFNQVCIQDDERAAGVNVGRQGHQKSRDSNHRAAGMLRMKPDNYCYREGGANTKRTSRCQCAGRITFAKSALYLELHSGNGGDGFSPQILGTSKIVSEDALRRALAKMSVVEDQNWLRPPAKRGSLLQKLKMCSELRRRNRHHISG
ncbi:MAG: hypothetical protein ABR905_18820 [Terracidiphilus sp.]